MRSLLIACLACAACHVELGDGNIGGNQPDARTSANPDSPNQQQTDAANTTGIDGAVAACPSGRKLFLNFDGQALTDAPSDATLNRASWIINGTANPAAPASARSAADKLAIISGVRNQLAAFPIEVVTTRPAQGSYMMVLYGGNANNVGSRFGAVQELDCGDVRKNDVAWVADNITPAQLVVNFTIGSIGFGLGLTATTATQDCMCAWDNNCQLSYTNSPCTLSPNIARDQTARQLCAGLTTQNEQAAFQTGFCQ